MSEMHTRETGPCHLLSVPPELRLMIYSHTFTTSFKEHDLLNPGRTLPSASLLATHPLARAEATPIYRRATVQLFDENNEAAEWVIKIDSTFCTNQTLTSVPLSLPHIPLAHLRKIRFQFSGLVKYADCSPFDPEIVVAAVHCPFIPEADKRPRIVIKLLHAENHHLGVVQALERIEKILRGLNRHDVGREGTVQSCVVLEDDGEEEMEGDWGRKGTWKLDVRRVTRLLWFVLSEEEGGWMRGMWGLGRQRRWVIKI